MSHDDSSRFMRAPLRGVNEFPLFLFLQEGAQGEGCDDVLLFFRDRRNERTERGRVTLMSDGTSLLRERNPR